MSQPVPKPDDERSEAGDPAWVREKRPMNEAEWLAESNLFYLLIFLDCQKDKHARRLRLFACACCRRVWGLLRFDAAKRCVELAEAYADGEVTREELLAAHASAGFDTLGTQERGEADAGTQISRRTLDAIGAARFLTSDYYFDIDGATIVAQDTSKDPSADYLPAPREYPGNGVPSDLVEMAEQLELLRDIVGNPFRQILIDGSWRSPTVLRLATAAYDERALPSGHLDPARLAVLSDALEEAGCADADLLGHLRSAGPHVRGCWALDFLLAKQ